MTSNPSASPQAALDALMAITPIHRAEIALVVGMLLLLGLAPKIEKSIPAVLAIGLTALVAAVGLVAFGASGAPMIVIATCIVAALGFLLLPRAELFDVRQLPECGALLLVLAVGGIALLSGENLLELALGVEMISLSATTLIALGRGQRPLEGAFKYFVLTAVTFAALLFGMSLIVLGTGSVALPNLTALSESARVFVHIGAALFAVGLLFKIAAAPLHFGALDAYTVGPASFAGAIMVISKLAAGFALARLTAAVGGGLSVGLAVLGCVTIAGAVFASFSQTDLRRLLAYSAVAHAGFIVLAAATGSTSTVAFYAICYGASALLAFAAIAGTGTSGLPMSRLQNTDLTKPATAWLIVALMSLAGVPPLPGFWAKLAVLKVSFGSFGLLPTAVAALFGVLGLIYYLRPVPDLLARARTAAAGTLNVRTTVFAVLLVVMTLGSLVPAIIWRFVGGN